VPELPIPPIEFRRLAGPTDPAAFDNPSGGAVFPEVSEQNGAVVFDFGCGCGRHARKFMQQRARPARYVGVDQHKGMVNWCAAELAPLAHGFEFHHHDAQHPVLNPAGTPGHLPLPVGDGEVTLFIA